jgi:O-antigen ligase
MQSKLENTYYYICLLLAASLPFHFDGFQLTSFLIGLLALTTIAFSIIGRPSFHRIDFYFAVLFVIGYFFYAAGLLYSENLRQGFFVLEKKLSLLIIPIIFLFGPKVKSIRATLLTFSFSCAGATFICVITAVFRALVNHDVSFLFYHSLSGIVGMHASYLSMYLCFAIAILLFNLDLNLWGGQKKLVVTYTAIVTMLLGVFLLSARTQQVILIFELGLFSIYYMSKKYGVFFSTLSGFVASFVIFLIVVLIPHNRERFKQAINYNNQYSIGAKWGENQIRLPIWSCALSLIRERPFFGFGTGDSEDELQKCYIENSYTSLTYFPNTRFNAHNQFLETSLQIGSFACLFFLVSLVWPITFSFLIKNYLYIVFAIIFGISCMTESMLERQQGVSFYAFFSSLLIFKKND